MSNIIWQKLTKLILIWNQSQNIVRNFSWLVGHSVYALVMNPICKPNKSQYLGLNQIEKYISQYESVFVYSNTYIIQPYKTTFR